MSDNPLALVPWRRGELLAAEDSGPEVIQIGGVKEAETVPTTITTKTPRREPGLEADVAVPGLQAAITAVMVALAVALISWAAGWSWKVTAIAFALALVGGWFWRLRLMDSLLWTVEVMTGRDFNGDGATGKPTPTTVYTVANPAQARSTVAAETRQDEQAGEQAALQAFYDRCLMTGCSERDHGVKAGSGAARDAYIAHRDTLFALGLAGWRGRSPNGGWELKVRNRQRAAALIAKHVLNRGA